MARFGAPLWRTPGLDQNTLDLLVMPSRHSLNRAPGRFNARAQFAIEQPVGL
ncbi:MAG: hypothetical protein ACRERS_00485 [Methylococcales bacterium]